jgi:hypothetical protein
MQGEKQTRDRSYLVLVLGLWHIHNEGRKVHFKGYGRREQNSSKIILN